MSYGHPLARCHLSIFMCPPSAASLHASSSYGHPLARSHFSTFRYMLSAANVHARPFHETLLARSHLSTSKSPRPGASSQRRGTMYYFHSLLIAQLRPQFSRATLATAARAVVRV